MASTLVACPDCDLLQRVGEIPEGARAQCPRCGAVLRRRSRNGVERTLALSFSALVLFAVANSFPFLGFDMKGQITQTTLLTGVFDLYAQGMWELAGLVAVTAVIAPLLQIVLLLYVLLPVQLGRVPWEMAAMLRLLLRVQVWSMMEVFLVGIVVAVTKLVAMAQVLPGVALWAFALLIVVLAGAMSSFDAEAVWQRLEADRA